MLSHGNAVSGSAGEMDRQERTGGEDRFWKVEALIGRERNVLAGGVGRGDVEARRWKWTVVAGLVCSGIERQ